MTVNKIPILVENTLDYLYSNLLTKEVEWIKELTKSH
jgi:hypothetical protein